MKHNYWLYTVVLCAIVALAGCKGRLKQDNWTGLDTIPLSPCPVFEADSAMNHIRTQCSFGPRMTGTPEADACAMWIERKFASYGCTVTEHNATVTTWEGRQLPCRNIIASLNPEAKDRVVICSHWDTRPWADNDPDESNHHTPILGANDAASGVAVMLEMARIIRSMPLKNYGIDFICFDAEDMGIPQWAEDENTEDSQDTWCLGSRAWAEQAANDAYSARYGILLDMVGGRGTSFARERVSMQYALPIVDMLWNLAIQIGYGDYFDLREGGSLVDDHVNVNTIAGIPCIDVVPFCTDASSSFGPTWHTVADTPENIDPAVLQAVGQSIIQMLYNDDK
ncbi:MAG: M28 family peptidase [Bacteroidaceae bacterium]|nr:M28 family peptidase [Bacteroidaceae bacterium]